MGTVAIKGYARSTGAASAGELSVIALLRGYAQSSSEDSAAKPMYVHNDSYLSPLQRLLPFGALWNRDPGTQLTEFLRGLSYSFLNVGRRAIDLLREIDPRQTLELLTDWETAFEIPGDCGELSSTVAGRREDLVAKIRGNDDPNESTFLEVATEAGYPDATIKTWSPFVAGSLAGDPICDRDWQFRFEVVRHPGASDTQLACRIDAISPVHTYHDQHASYSQWNERTVTGSMFAAFFGPGPYWVIAGAAGEIYTSPDLTGTTWTAQTPAGAFAGTFQDGAYGASLFVLVGTGGEIQTSPDGEVWTARVAAGAYAGDFRGIHWDDDEAIFVAVGTLGEIQTSPDGINWTARTADAAYAATFRGVTFGADAGLWVIAGDTGEIQTSPDGTTWTRRSPVGTYTQAFQDAAYNPLTGVFVLAGDDVGTYEGLFTSPDGINWTAKNLNVSGTIGFFSCAYSPVDGTVVVFNASNRVQSSIDDLTTLYFRNRTINAGTGRIGVSPDGRMIVARTSAVFYSDRELMA
jgi:uncharacterized protein YmfQ (DUF2313 family)